MCAIASSGLAHSVSRPSVSMTTSSRPGGVKRGPGNCAPASGTGTRRPPGSYWSDVSPGDHSSTVRDGQSIARAERSAAAIDSKNASAWQTTLPLRSPRATTTQP